MKTDVAIIGAGAAGLSAALYLSGRGLDIVVLDEYFRAGGRLLGQRYEDPRKPAGERLWNGKEIAARLFSQVELRGVKVLTGVSVWNLTPDCKLEIAGGPCGEIQAGAVLVATGAAERAVPVKGWTLPGVMSIGAAQTFTNLHGVLPGKRVVIAGIDPLSIVVARELKMAGASVAGIFLPPPGILAGKLGIPPEVIGSLACSADMAPNIWLKITGAVFGNKYRNIGAMLCNLSGNRVWGIPVHLRRAVIRIEGDDTVESVVTATISIDGKLQKDGPSIAADAVCISGGLYPLTELISLAGCPLVDVPALGGNIPLHGPLMQTPVKGIFVAGNITGIEGAPVAMAQGTLAGAGIAAYLNRLGEDARLETEPAQSRVVQAREDAPVRFHPDVAAARQQVAGLWAEWNEQQNAGLRYPANQLSRGA